MRLHITIAVSLCLALAYPLAGQTRSPEAQLKAAQHKEQVEGDLKGAIDQYKQLVARRDITRGVAAEDKHRTRMTVADESDALPDMHRLPEAVTTLRNEHHADAGRFLHAIDGPLQRVGVVTNPVCVRTEGFLGELDGCGIVGTLRKVGLRVEVGAG